MNYHESGLAKSFTDICDNFWNFENRLQKKINREFLENYFEQNSCETSAR